MSLSVTEEESIDNAWFINEGKLAEVDPSEIEENKGLFREDLIFTSWSMIGETTEVVETESRSEGIVRDKLI
jgi:hypothetical protein